MNVKPDLSDAQAAVLYYKGKMDVIQDLIEHSNGLPVRVTVNVSGRNVLEFFLHDIFSHAERREALRTLFNEFEKNHRIYSDALASLKRNV